jgi:hypothetical protein
MLPIHVFYAIDLVRERQRDEARRTAIQRERQASRAEAPRPNMARRAVARGTHVVRAGASSVGRALYEQAVDGRGTSESSAG